MKAVLVVLLCSFIGIKSQAQNILTWNDSIPLKWDDFKGKAKDTSIFDAEAFSEIGYTYTFYSPLNYRFDVQAFFHRNISWMKKENCSEALLKHEQLHFAIAKLYACRLQLAFESYRYSANFKAEVLQVFEPLKAEYHSTQRKFDEETNHSLDNVKEKEWETVVREELIRLNKLLQNKAYAIASNPVMAESANYANSFTVPLIF